MKKISGFLFWFSILLVATILILSSSQVIKASRIFSLVSPVPQLLTDKFYQPNTAQFWRPNLTKENPITNPPDLTSHAAISYDLTTNKLLYAKNIDEKLPIASLTKIMTAIVVLENMKTDEELTVSKSAADIGQDSMGLSQGEKLKVEDLLYGLILKSGNDASEVLAQGSEFKREDFVYLMNKKAEDLGLSNTNYTNPSGLQGDGKQYSTAMDLLIITRYALQKPLFAKIAATFEYDIPQTSTHKAYTLYNETNLLTSYPGVKGVKTGYTNEAGMCLITYLDYKGHKIIAVVLNSENRRAEMQKLLDFSLKDEGVTPPVHD